MKWLPILSLSWKNIWRSRTRSGVVIIAVTLGTLSGTFITAFFYGMSMQYIKNQLENETSHIQLHLQAYDDDKLPRFFIPAADSVIEVLGSEPYVLSVSSRSVVQGLASSSSNSYGVSIKGIDPEREKTISNIHTHIIDGTYFEGSGRNPVVIGSKLAERLGVGIRSKIVLNFQDVNGNLTAGAFRVNGIFKSFNSTFDENTLFVRFADLNRLLDAPTAVHEIALIVDDFKQADVYAEELQASSSLSIKSWGDVSPTLRYTDSSLDVSLYIFMIIIIVALMFGIVNTMLMAVLERTQEIGMLMAVGVNKIRTFSLILLETFFLTLVGAPVGLFLGWLAITYFGSTGIDLGAFAQGFEMYGMSSMIYPEINPDYFLNVGLMMIVTTLFASVYPSIKALRLNPVEAIRKI